MIQLSEEELVDLIHCGKLEHDQTSLIVGVDGYAAVHHDGQIQCFLPSIEKALKNYRDIIDHRTLPLRDDKQRTGNLRLDR